ncbi:MAG: hypothetical protein OXF68_00375 [Gammaproteobacteria bacterium]|nr:hypothetical protein [Gammaproteobacteria bacterium]
MARINIDLDVPVKLEPVTVAKPWGREIWHSAIEARGESAVRTAAGSVPLSRYLEAVGIEAPVILLKVLDPRPTPVLGDLYFEVHARKREIYVVTAIDRKAWPDGCGRIRLGMDQARRQSYGNDGAFRAAYLAAVLAYERERRAIDAAERPSGAEERQLRAAMEAFTACAPLQVGDVVTVPPWMPHALQHGVRVVEFQTPIYERRIISFAQKVLTQGHWDSEDAIARMSLDPPPPPSFEKVAPGVERIAAFDDFGVWRAALDPHRSVALPAAAPYALCMAVGGMAQVGGLRLAAEEACLALGASLRRNGLLGDRGAACVLAAPGL